MQAKKNKHTLDYVSYVSWSYIAVCLVGLFQAMLFFHVSLQLCFTCPWFVGEVEWLPSVNFVRDVMKIT